MGRRPSFLSDSSVWLWPFFLPGAEVQAVLGDVFLHLRRDETPDAPPAPNLLPNGARRDIQSRQGGAVQLSPSRKAVTFSFPTIAMRHLFFNTQPRGGRRREGRPGPRGG